MTTRFDCDDKDTLVSYLYGEGGLEARRAVDAHLERCAACAREVQELRGMRATLAAWVPPDAELGFRIIREPAASAPRRWWQTPAWAPAALAAGLVLALAASVEVEYSSGAVTIRINAANLRSATMGGAGSLRIDRMKGNRVTVGLRGPGLDAAALVPPPPAPALVVGLAGLTNHDNVGAAFRIARGKREHPFGIGIARRRGLCQEASPWMAAGKAGLWHTPRV